MRLILFLLLTNTLFAGFTENIVRQEIKKSKTTIPEHLIMGLAEHESSFNPKATNGDSFGIFQIRLDTAKRICGVKTIVQLYAIRKNTQCAIKYLEEKAAQYTNDFVKVIASYNSGDYYVCTQKHIEKDYDCIIGFPINMDYVSDIYERSKKYIVKKGKPK